METIHLNPSPAATLETVAGVARRARKELGCLDDQLLVLRLNLGKLRAALTGAFAPITATVAPWLNSAVRAVTDFCDDAGSVIAALFGTVYKKAVKTTKASGAALRRTLADFDQIQRLNGGSGSGGSQTTVEYVPINDPLTPQLEQTVQRIRAIMAEIQALIAPLRAIDLTPAAVAFGALGASIADFGALLGDSLGWAWHNLLVPLAAWTIQEAVPASVDLLTAALNLLTAALDPLLAGIRLLQPALEPVARFLRDTLAILITNIRDRFEALTACFAQRSPQIQAIFANIAQIISALWEAARPPLENLRTFFSHVFTAVTDAAMEWLGHMTDAFQGLTEFLAGVFTGDWGRAWEGLKLLLKGAVNGVIGLLNSLLNGMAAGLNNITSALNKWHVDIPQWVPLIGGKTFGFQLKPISAPQIPYLAQGAVLPANKPFLAVVGDQKNGTNIEAPLATIQEAVATVMEDLTAGNMAGHEATAELLRQILLAVHSIHIGDDDIAAACRRSQSRMAVVRGGGYA